MSERQTIKKLLCTDDRRRVWRALRLGREIKITPDGRAVDRDTGEVYGNQLAAQALVFSRYARWRRGCDWVIEWNRDHGSIGHPVGAEIPHA